MSVKGGDGEHFFERGVPPVGRSLGKAFLLVTLRITTKTGVFPDAKPTLKA